MKKILVFAMVCVGMVGLVAMFTGPRLFGHVISKQFGQAQEWTKNKMAGPSDILDMAEDQLERSADRNRHIRAAADAKQMVEKQKAMVRQLTSQQDELKKNVRAIRDVVNQNPLREEFRFADERGVQRLYTRQEVIHDIEKKVNALESLKSQITSAREMLDILTARYDASMGALRSLQRDIDQAKAFAMELRTKNEIIAEQQRRLGITDTATNAKDLAEANRMLSEVNKQLSQQLAELDIRSGLRSDVGGINPLVSQPTDLWERVRGALGEESPAGEINPSASQPTDLWERVHVALDDESLDAD